MFSNRQLVRLIVPLLVEQLLVMLVGMADTIMVSSAGEAAISGVSIVNDVNNLMINLLSALAGGGAVIVSQYLGFGDRENVKRSASQLVMISFLISTGLGLICFALHRQILMLWLLRESISGLRHFPSRSLVSTTVLLPCSVP